MTSCFEDSEVKVARIDFIEAVKELYEGAYTRISNGRSVATELKSEVGWSKAARYLRSSLI